MSIERNQPCPCGSGRKFKKCCQQRLDNYKATLRVDDRLREKLVKYMETELSDSEIGRAAEAFFGGKEPASQADMLRFNAWLIHDLRLDRGGNLIEHFLAERERKLPPDELALLKDRLATRPGAYELARLRPGIGEDLVDIITGERFDVMDMSASRVLCQWDVVWARLVRLGDEWTIDGSAVPFLQGDKDDVASTLRKHWKSFRKGHPDAKLEDALRGRFASIDRELTELHDGVTTEAYTREGDRVALSKAVYSVRDYPLAKRKLEAIGSLKRGSPSEENAGEVYLDWVEEKSKVPEASKRKSRRGVRSIMLETEIVGRPGPGLLVMGNIHLAHDRLELECISEERLRRLRKMVDSALGDLISFRDVSIASAEDLTEGLPEYEEPDEDIELLTELKREYIDEWLHTPVPPLGGLSPLEAARTEKGRVEIQEMLKYLVNVAARGGRPFFDLKDAEKIAKTLGVSMPS